MRKKWGGPVLAVAMVWFTTHFGGGFASGRQLAQYYLRFGWIGVFMPLLAMGLCALAFYYTLEFARYYKVYDYRGWANIIYHPLQKILFPILDFYVLYSCIVVVGVSYATAGSTMNQLMGLSYPLCVFCIAVVVFFLSIYGADTIRSAAKVFSAIIIVGLLITYGFLIANNWGRIGQVMAAKTLPNGVFPSVWQAIMYCSYQVSCYTWVAVADVIKTREDSKRAAIIGFLLNGGFLFLAALALVGFYPDVNQEVVPTLWAIEQSGGGIISQFLVSMLISVGATSTAVNVGFGASRRIVLLLSKGKEPTQRHEMIANGIIVGLTFVISMLGLTTLVAKGYGIKAYLAGPIVLLPMLIFGARSHGMMGKEKPIETNISM